MLAPSADLPQDGGPPQNTQRRGDCVVVDTNELRSSLLLNSTMGAALLFEIQQRNGKLGWPEVIEDEIRKQAMRCADEAINRVRDELRVLETLIGWRPDPKLPSKEEVDLAISRRIAELSPILMRVSFTIEHARAALRRVNDETPPNASKNQQFKDSAIWEAILELAVAHRMHFVTKDTGFYQGRDLKRGLARELSTECDRAGLEIHVYSELASCVEALRMAAPPFDSAAVTAALDDPLRTGLSTEAAKLDLALGGITNSHVSAFITERLGILAIKYDIIYSGTDTSSQVPPRTEVSISSSGNARFDMGSGIASDVQLGRVEIRYLDAEGERKHLYLYVPTGILTIGERLVQYHLERPIDS